MGARVRAPILPYLPQLCIVSDSGEHLYALLRAALLLIPLQRISALLLIPSPRGPLSGEAYVPNGLVKTDRYLWGMPCGMGSTYDCVTTGGRHGRPYPHGLPAPTPSI